MMRNTVRTHPTHYRLDRSEHGFSRVRIRNSRGDKIRLRPLQEDDLPRLAAWWNDPAWMVLQQAAVFPTPEASTVEMFRNWSRNDNPRGFSYSIEEIESGKLLGHVAVWGVDPVVRAGTLGIMIGGEFVEHGFGTDTMRVVLRYAFEELGLNKIELNVWEFNTRALRTYERVGFVVEGTRRAAAFHAGKFWSQIHMGILRSEYLEARQKP